MLWNVNWDTLLSLIRTRPKKSSGNVFRGTCIAERAFAGSNPGIKHISWSRPVLKFFFYGFLTSFAADHGSLADRVAEVRKEAVHLLSQILARLVDHEWSDLVESLESSELSGVTTLTELFVQDLVNGFANTQKWTRRQT